MELFNASLKIVFPINFQFNVLEHLITVDLLLKHVLALYAGGSGGLKIHQSCQNKHHHIADLKAG